MLVTHSLTDLIEKEFLNLSVSHPCRQYIISLFSLPEGPPQVKGSILLEWSEVRASGAFSTYQRLGDWVTWRAGMSHIPLDFEDIHMQVACMSYKHCDQLLKGTWKIYGELSDNLPEIIGEIRGIFKSFAQPHQMEATQKFPFS
jgi:hypothetical protein